MSVTITQVRSAIEEVREAGSVRNHDGTRVFPEHWLQALSVVAESPTLVTMIANNINNVGRPSRGA